MPGRGFRLDGVRRGRKAEPRRQIVARHAEGYTLVSAVEECLSKLRSDRTRAALSYWDKVRGDRPCPARADIDPAEMLPFLPNILLIDVLHAEQDYRYRLIGTRIDAHMLRPYTGVRLSDIPHQRAPSNIWSQCDAVVATVRPYARAVPYIGPHRDFVTAEDVMMPLAPEGQPVDIILVAVDFFRPGDNRPADR